MITSFPQPDFGVLLFDNPGQLAREAAQRITLAASRAVDAGVPFRMALSGGATPLETYRALAGEPFVLSIHWPSVQLFWGDERFVAHDHELSSYAAARGALLEHLPSKPGGVFPVPTDVATPEESAASYQETLRQAFQLGPEEVPRFDLILLGLGTDGHTASLFPGALPRGDRSTLVAGVSAEGVVPPRVTLTPPTLCAARHVIFLVSGAEKAQIVERVLRAQEPDPALPATLVRPVRGKVTWMLDRAAAAGIEEAATKEVPDGWEKGDA